MKEIPLTQGYVTLVDDEDYPLVADRKWTASVRRYAVYAQTRSVLMHRLILGHPAGDVDHRNGNAGGSSRFKGVSWCKRDALWQVGISPSGGGKRVALGRFADEEYAARLYDAAARAAFGEFARLNFPKPGEQSAHRVSIGAP